MRGHAKTFKALVFPGGHMQVFQRDYKKIYGPIVHFTTCIIVLLILFSKEWLVGAFSVRVTFLNCSSDQLVSVLYPHSIPTQIMV